VEFDIKRYLPKDQLVTNIVIMPYDTKQWYKMNLIAGNLDWLRRDNGPMLNSKGAFRMLDFSLVGVSSKEDIVPRHADLKDLFRRIIMKILDVIGRKSGAA
jgi:hypothetical protein